MFANRLNVEYTLDLAVRNVEGLNVSSFVMGVHMSELLIFFILWILLTCLLGSPKHLMVSVYLFVFYFTIRPY